MKILLADPAPNIRYGLVALLEGQPDIEIVGEAEDRCELFEKLHRSEPDLVLLSGEFQRKGDSTVLGEIIRKQPGVSIIVIGMRPEMRETAIVAGADAFISIGDSPDVLLSAIHRIWSISVGKNVMGSPLHQPESLDKNQSTI